MDLKQCYFCNRFYLSENVIEVKVDSAPGAIHEKNVYICHICKALVEANQGVLVVIG